MISAAKAQVMTWGWALAFLWMPALALAFMAAVPGRWVVFAMPVAAVGIGFGARTMIRSDAFPFRKLWFWLNLIVGVPWTILTVGMLLIVALRAAGFRFAP